MKTKIYLLVFSILIGFVVFTIYTKKAKEREANKYKNFKVENFDKVSKIVVTDKQGKIMTFEPDGNNWILNNKYIVSKGLFSEMEEALTKMEALNPVAKVAQEHVVKEMIAHAIKVAIYKGKENPEKTIYIGGPNYAQNASNMFLEYDGIASEKIYEVGIPGFRGYLTTRFLVNEKDWRTKKIFDIDIENFKEITVKFFNGKGNKNFQLQTEGKTYKLNIEGKEIDKSLLNEVNIVNYIMQLQNQYLMSYSFLDKEDEPIKDSLLLANKFAEINIKDLQGEIIDITVVDMPLSDRSKVQYDQNGDLMAYDVDYKYIIFGEKKYWGIIDNDKFGRLYIDANKLLNN